MTESPRQNISFARYRLAGSLAMINALLTIPWFLMTFFMAHKEGLAPRLIDAGMQGTSAFIFVYTYLTLRSLLNRNFSFSNVNRFIDWMIKANVVLTAISLIGVASPAIASSAGTLALIFIVPLGVIQIFFGLRLLLLPSDLGGLLRPYCYLNIATGFSLATIVLLPVGVLTGAVADIMLGTIFFQTASLNRLIDTEV